MKRLPIAVVPFLLIGGFLLIGVGFAAGEATGSASTYTLLRTVNFATTRAANVLAQRSCSEGFTEAEIVVEVTVGSNLRGKRTTVDLECNEVTWTNQISWGTISVPLEPGQ